MCQTHDAAGAEYPCLKDETRVGGDAGSWRAKANHGDGADCVASAGADQSHYADAALLRLEGEAYAAGYLTRLRAGTAQPEDLAVLMAFLTEELRYGACALLHKVLEKGARHG